MNQNVPLSNTAIAVILGSILGDGSLKLHKKYANARFSMRHSIKQSEYFYSKVKLLEEISSTKSVFRQKSDGFSSFDKLRFQSKALSSLTEIYNLTHKKDNLRIRRKWLNQMTAISIAIWWFDDGSLISNSRKGVFCTDGFELRQLKVLVQYLYKVWDIYTTIAPVKRSRGGKQREYYRLWIRSTEELKKLLRIVLPYTSTKIMLPKVLLLYKDSQLQQRWISEVEKNTNFSYEQIEKYVQDKKKKWKIFRE